MKIGGLTVPVRIHSGYGHGSKGKQVRNLCELVTVSGKYLRYIVSLGNTGKADTDAMIREPGDLPPVRYGMTTSNWPGYQKRREDLKTVSPSVSMYLTARSVVIQGGLLLCRKRNEKFRLLYRVPEEERVL